MNTKYYAALDNMETAGADPEYVLGWASGYVGNPKREEQRVTEAYEAGYEDGRSKTPDGFSKWVAKAAVT